MCLSFVHPISCMFREFVLVRSVYTNHAKSAHTAGAKDCKGLVQWNRCNPVLDQTLPFFQLFSCLRNLSGTMWYIEALKSVVHRCGWVLCGRS